MRTPSLFIISILFLVSPFVSASSFQGKAPESGIIISINPEKIPSKSGESILINGTIKYVKKSQSKPKDDVSNGSDKKNGLLEEFKAQGIDIVGAFPSSAVDISSELTLESSSDNEIRFSYQSKNIIADDLNQFSLKVYNNHTNKSALKKLSIIQGKIEKRIQLLTKLKNKFESGKAKKEAIAVIEKEIAKLTAISSKIANKLNTNGNLMAENTYAIQVDNLTANFSKISTVMNDFRFVIDSNIGSVIQGMSVNFKAKIVSLSHANENSDSTEGGDGYLAEFYFNDQKVSSQKVIEPRKNLNIVFDYATASLQSADQNVFSIALYHLDDAGQKGRKIGSLNYKIPVITDSVKPTWLSGAVPNHQDRYVQLLRTINLKTQDSFGRIDPQSFKLLVNRQGAITNLSHLISTTKFDDGSRYEFTGDINPLEEGEYSLSAKVSDFAGNAADTYNVMIHIDRTVPVVNTTLVNNTLTNQTSIEVPITVNDLSPTATDIYVNNELTMTSGLKVFSASATLTIEGNNIVRIESRDAAGNVALVREIVVVRDTTPPVLSNILPITNSTIDTIQFPVSANSNEKLGFVKINDMAVALTGEKVSFSATYAAKSEGNLLLNITYADEAGNEGSDSYTVNIKSKLLNIDLVNIGTYEDTKLLVTGLEYATRPGSRVEISTGFFGFNSAEMESNEHNGSFALTMNYFESAILKVTDLSTGETAQGTLSFDTTKTKLSGIVKDSNNVPLPGVTVRITGSVSTYVTDGAGMFSINNAPSGDQSLLVDGSTVSTAVAGPNNKFFATKVSINVGLGQNNVLDNPIYLTPLYLDGTQTVVQAGVATTVSSVHAPGVELRVPANIAVFPNGSNIGAINVVKLNADFATIPVPDFAVPNFVYAFEPSGLTFKQRVELKLPNENELPPGMELLIYSMNSAKGKWEVDGAAKVSEDGLSVVSKPGLGISHFSPLYAVPLAPLMYEVKNPKLAGVDASEGSLTKSITLPSYKSLGIDITPSLTYKSAWAAPSTIVSNILGLPETKVEMNGSFIDSVFQAKTVNRLYCTYDESNVQTCTTIVRNYLDRIDSSFVGNVKSFYEPEEIKSQYFVGGIGNSLANVNFTNSVSTPVLGDSKFADSNIVSKVGTYPTKQERRPLKSQVGYFIELKNPENDEYLETGIYPSFARYQITFKNIRILTGTQVVTAYRNGKRIGAIRRTYDNRVETQVLDQAMPKDVLGSLLVQSKVKSSYGRGWDLNGVQQIVNPEGSRILIENEDNSLATYVLNNTIENVFNANGTEFDLTTAVDLSHWPNALLQKTSGSTNSVIKYNLSTGSWSSVGLIDRYNGTIGSEGLDQCQAQYTGPTCSGRYGQCGASYNELKQLSYMPVAYKYGVKPNLSGVIQGQDGNYYGLDSKSHMLFKLQQGTISKMAGNRSSVYDFVKSNTGLWRLEMNQNQMSQLCQNIFGKDCPFQRYETEWKWKCADMSGSTFSPAIFRNGKSVYYRGNYRFCPTFNQMVESGDYYVNNIEGIQAVYDIESSCVSRGGQNGYHPNLIAPLANFTGDVGISGFADGNIANPDVIGLNNPRSMLTDFAGNIIFADYGNNRVRRVNLAGNTIQTIAGNGATSDSGDGGSATSASIYHPTGLAIDGLGQIYIATENGYIRKIDVNGNISTVAGRPFAHGGLLASEGIATEMVLNNPSGLVVDSDNSLLYIADTGNNRILRVDLVTNAAITVAGTGNCDLSGLGNNTPALSASLCAPSNIGLDTNKNLIVVDSGHKMIRRVVLHSGADQLTYLPSNKDLSKLVKSSDGTWTRHYRNGSKAYFNASGAQTSIADRAGRTISFNYDADGLLVQIKNNVTNQTTILDYNSNNQLKSFRDPALRTTKFSYSGEMLERVEFPDTSSRSYAYDLKGLMLSEFDQLSAETKFEFNKFNRVSKVIFPNLTETNVTDQESASLLAADLGDLKSFGSSQDNVKSQVIDLRGVKTEFVKGFDGLVTEVSDSNGVVSKIYHDLDGRIIKTIDPEDKELQMKYDPNSGDLIQAIDVENDIKTSFTYNVFGQPVSATDGLGTIAYAEYDPVSGFLSKTKSSVPGVETEYFYNPNGTLSLKIRKKDNESFNTSYVYDSLGNLKEVTDADNKKVTYLYDDAGNVVKSIRQISGSVSSEVNYEYDEMNRLNKVTSSKGEITTYNYYPSGKLHKVTDPKSKISTYVYNNMGQLLSKQRSSGEVQTFAYDPHGQWIHETDPNGVVKKYNYNGINRLSRVELPDDLITYTYNLNGELKTAANKNSKVSYDRDSMGRLAGDYFEGQGTFENLEPLAITYEYDKNSNRTKTTLNGIQSYNYAYDGLNRLTQISNPYGDVFTYEYDSLNRVTRLARPNGETKYSYKANHLISEIQHKLNGLVKSQYQYDYDLRNFITQKRDLASTQSYSYDLNGQLSGVQGAESEAFTYDSVGNRISDQDGTYSYDATTDRLIEDYKYSYIYDNNGNLIAKNPKNQSEKAYRYEYSSTNQLKQVSRFSGPFGAVEQQVKFEYDVFGRRMKKEIVDSTTTSKNNYAVYRYDGDNVIRELKYTSQRSSLDVVANYTYSMGTDDVLAVNIPTTGEINKKAKQAGNYYFLKDHLGSIVAVSDVQGEIKQQYSYSSYGNIVQVKDGAGVDILSDPFIDNQFTYAGREFDSELNLYYNRARYYDSAIGRFLQQDPFPGKIGIPNSVVNSYIYGLNNPTMFRDPSGKFPALLVAFAVGAILGGFMAAYQPGATFGSVVAGALTGGALAAAGTAIVTLGALGGAGIAAKLGATAGSAGMFLGGAIGGGLANVAWGMFLGVPKELLALYAIQGFIGGGMLAQSNFGGAFTGNRVENVAEGVSTANQSAVGVATETTNPMQTIELKVTEQIDNWVQPDVKVNVLP